MNGCDEKKLFKRARKYFKMLNQLILQFAFIHIVKFFYDMLLQVNDYIQCYYYFLQLVILIADELWGRYHTHFITTLLALISLQPIYSQIYVTYTYLFDNFRMILNTIQSTGVRELEIKIKPLRAGRVILSSEFCSCCINQVSIVSFQRTINQIEKYFLAEGVDGRFVCTATECRYPLKRNGVRLLALCIKRQKEIIIIYNIIFLFLVIMTSNILMTDILNPVYIIH